MTDELDEESVENMAVDASEFGLSTSRSIFEELWHSISRLCFKTILFPGLLSQQAVPLEQEWPRGRVLVLASSRGSLWIHEGRPSWEISIGDGLSESSKLSSVIFTIIIHTVFKSWNRQTTIASGLEIPASLSRRAILRRLVITGCNLGCHDQGPATTSMPHCNRNVEKLWRLPFVDSSGVRLASSEGNGQLLRRAWASSLCPVRSTCSPRPKRYMRGQSQFSGFH